MDKRFLIISGIKQFGLKNPNYINAWIIKEPFDIKVIDGVGTQLALLKVITEDEDEVMLNTIKDKVNARQEVAINTFTTRFGNGNITPGEDNIQFYMYFLAIDTIIEETTYEVYEVPVSYDNFTDKELVQEVKHEGGMLLGEIIEDEEWQKPAVLQFS